MPFFIVRRDITRLTVDAIVNPANTSLAPGGGVCGAIYHGAGFDNMVAACEPLAPIQVGDAVITPGFKLSAKYVIHTAGPIYDPKKRSPSRGTRSIGFLKKMTSTSRWSFSITTHSRSAKSF